MNKKEQHKHNSQSSPESHTDANATSHTKPHNTHADQSADDTATAASNHNAELAAAKDQLLRLQAEFANYRRRTDEERMQSVTLGKSAVLKSVIGIIDDFELALKHASKLEEFKHGMEMVYAKLVSAAEEHGLERINSLGEQFNAYEHEALLAETSDKPEQTILEELQPGYRLGNQVIRTAKVKVAKK